MNNIDPTDALFCEAEQSLLKVDALLRNLTRRFGAKLELNYHGRPRRDIRAKGSDGIERTLEVATVLIEPEEGGKRGNYQYLIGLAASKGTGSRVRCWIAQARVFRTLPDVQTLENIIVAGWERLQRVTNRDLQYACK